MTYLAAFDFETHWLERGVLNPRPVCMSHGTDRDMVNIALMAGDDMWRNAAGVIYRYLKDPECIVTGVNLPFDFAVAVTHLGLPLSAVVEAIEAGRVRTVDIRENLIAIANGWTSDKGFGGKVDPRTGKTFSRSLAAMVMAYYGVDISGDKKDPTAPRMRYHEMDGVPLEQWPDAFKLYPKDDITWPISIYKDQLNTPCTPIGPLVEPDGRITNETEQLMAQFVLHVMAMNGPRTDPRVARLFRQYHEDASQEGYDIGEKHGFLRWNKKRFEQDDGTYLPGWSEVQKDMKQIVADSWGGRVPQKWVTDSGVKGGHCSGGYLDVTKDTVKYVALSQEALEACSDERMRKYARGANSRKMINQYAPILELALTCPLTSSPNVLVNTGRTSWRDPNLQNPPREGGFREGLVARDGCLFGFADYSFVELVTLAQLQLWEYGRSTLADIINAGQDPHAWFGAKLLGITYAEMDARLAAGDKAAKAMRQAAKAANFGFPGGMGPARVVETYGVGTMVAIALEEDTAWMYDAEGNAVRDDEETAINVAKRLKTVWLDAFPEQQMIFNEVAAQTANGRLFTFRQRPFGDEPGITVKSGRVRGQVGYCDGCNTRFQGLAADIIKAAMWDIFKACYLDASSPLYGCRLWLLLHDELGVEGPEATAHEWSHELSRLMVAALSRYCPDVVGKADPALCRRWYKAADVVLDNDGRLAPWEPWRKVRTDGDDMDPSDWHEHTWVLDHCWGVQAFVDGDLTYAARIDAERALGIVT